MAVQRNVKVEQTITARVGTALVTVYVKDNEIDSVTLAWPQKEGSVSGWFEHEVIGYEIVLSDMAKAIGEALEVIGQIKEQDDKDE